MRNQFQEEKAQEEERFENVVEEEFKEKKNLKFHKNKCKKYKVHSMKKSMRMRNLFI